MAGTNIPYLCGGTFFTLILQAKKEKAKKTLFSEEGKVGEKEFIVTESHLLEELVSIYHLKPFRFEYGNTCKTYTSQYKHCLIPTCRPFKFENTFEMEAFLADLKRSDSIAFREMKNFVDYYIDEKHYEILVRSILELISKDKTDLEEDTNEIDKEKEN